MSNHEHLSPFSFIAQRFKLKCPYNKDYWIWKRGHKEMDCGDIEIANVDPNTTIHRKM